MIPPKTVEQILEAAQVEEIIGDFVQLKRRGVNMIGLCPFHNEKTPSFTVSPSKNIFKCFGCGVAGDATKFLMEHEHYTYPEALRFLARRYGIEIEERELTQEEREARQLSDSLFIVNEFAVEFFTKQLFETDTGRSVGLHYFKDRGFREEVIKKFQLGYAPKGPAALLNAAKQKKYDLDKLTRLGLISSEYQRDFFRERVMFTIHNLTGKPVAFAGRILRKDIKAPKYINSPETDIYHKSKILYGLFQAQKAVRQKDECIMVEGYTDVLSLHQAGIENVVASSGTSLTVEQIRLVKRYTPNIKILYDGDAAGVKAALRGVDLVLEQDLNVKIVLLPDQEDPDSYLQRVGAKAFEEYLDKEAKDFIFFKTSLLLQEAEGDPVKKAALLKDIVGSISRIPDPLKRSLYIKECATLLDVEEQLLVGELNRQLQALAKQQQRKQGGGSTDPSNSAPTTILIPPKKEKQELHVAFQERDIIRILMEYGDKVLTQEEGEPTVAEFTLVNIEESLEEFEDPLYQRVAQDCLDRLIKKQEISPNYYLNHPDKAISELAYELLHSEFEYSPGWEEKWELHLNSQKMPEYNFYSDSRQAILSFQLAKIRRMTENIQQKLSNTTDSDKIEHFLKIQMKLTELRKEIAQKRGTVVL